MRSTWEKAFVFALLCPVLLFFTGTPTVDLGSDPITTTTTIPTTATTTKTVTRYSTTVVSSTTTRTTTKTFTSVVSTTLTLSTTLTSTIRSGTYGTETITYETTVVENVTTTLSTTLTITLRDVSTSTFNVTSGTEVYVILIAANGTISNVSYEPVGNVLAFEVTDSIGTSITVMITVPKPLISSIENLLVTVDGSPISFTCTEDAENYVITFTYSSSTHLIAVFLNPIVKDITQSLTVTWTYETTIQTTLTSEKTQFATRTETATSHLTRPTTYTTTTTHVTTREVGSLLPVIVGGVVAAIAIGILGLVLLGRRRAKARSQPKETI